MMAIVSGAAFGAAAAPAAVQDTEHQFLMTRHVRDEARSAQAVGRLPAAQRLQFDIVLPVSAPAALDSFLADVYNPKSRSYRHFLTPAEFTRRFGPSAADWAEVVAFAKRSGFTILSGSRDEMDLRLSGTVAAVESAFHVTMRVYQHPTEARTFYSPDVEPTAALQAELWHISGLDNFALPKPRVHVRPGAMAVHADTWTGACPGNSYCGSDMRAAYYGSGALTGAGQSVGLVEYYGYDSADLATYFSNAGQVNAVPVNGISTDGTSVSCVYAQGCDDTEQTLDMTQAIGMAPGLAQLNVYVGSSDTAILSAMSVVPPRSVTGKVDAQLSCSWGWGPADPSVDDPFFQKFAAQGQTFLTAAGDSAAYTANSQAVFPADDANVTVVGGTDLATGGPGGAWSGETAWSDGGGGYFAPDNILIPAWQATAIGQFNAVAAKPGSTVLRNSPDVSAEANFDFYVCADQRGCVANEYGGTSFAAPMWAGYVALANQQAVANGQPTIGFLNPVLYATGAAGGSAYSAAFHDVSAGSNGYAAIAGYDLATGWGSPNGAGLIALLAGPATPGFSLAASGALTVSSGSTGTATLTSTASGGFTGSVALSFSGLPSGVTASASPGTIGASGTAALSFQVAAGVAAGSYPVTVTGSAAATATTAALTSTTTLALTVTNANFSLSAPAAVSANAGASGTLAITARASGGFAGSVALSAGGLPSGVTVSFSPAAISGATASTATVHVAAGVAGGTYPFVITGSSGALVRTATVTLTVTPPGFVLSVPAAATVAEANQVSVVLKSTVSGGFESPIGLSASGVPAGVTVSFGPATIAAGASSGLVFAATATAQSGSYPVTITGSGGSLTATATLTLTVTASGFTLVPTASSLAVVQGHNIATSIVDKATGGFAGPISLVATGQPAGMTVTFSPATITSAGGSTSTTFLVGTGVAPGSYPVTITGSSEGVSQTTGVTVVVSAPTFTLAGGASLSLPQGGSGTTTVSSRSTNGFSAGIALSASGQPTGVSVSFTPASISGVGTATVGLQVAASVPAGSYPITITGSGGSLTETTTVTLTVTVPSFTLTAAGSAPTVLQGAKGAMTLTSKAAGGFASTIQLAATGQPAGVTVAFTPATLAASGTTSASFQVAAGTATGAWPIVITGTSGALATSVTVTLNITAAGFTLTAPASSITIAAGAAGSVTLATAMTGTLDAPVSLSLNPPGNAATAALGTTSLTPPASVPLSFIVPAGVAAGSYPLSVVATSGSLTQTLNLTLVVTSPNPPTFSFTPSTTTLTLTHGTSATFAVQTAVTGSATPTITLALGGLPSGVTASFSPASVSGAGSSTVTLTATAAARTTSPATAVLSASAGGATQSSSLSLTVN
jgi:uncharacterized membrane protein